MSKLDPLRQAVAVSPDNVPLLLLLAQACLDEWSLDEARDAFERVLRLEPGRPEAPLGIARILHLGGKTSEAAVRTEALLARHPDYAPACIFLARLHLGEGNRAAAHTHYERALELDPTARDAALEAELDRGGSKPEPPKEEPEKVAVTGAGWTPGEDDGQGNAIDATEIERPKLTFADIGGMEPVKEEIRMKIIHPLRNPQLFKAYGKKIGGGVLLYGPPGCGKTLLSRATAGEIKANFLSIGIHQILDLYLGNSEKNLHALFELARTHAPAVLFFDEADSLFAKRTEVKSSNDRYANLEVNYLLQRMETYDGVTLLATNLEQGLDEAFKRRVRFSVQFELPEETERKRLWISMFPPQVPLAADIDWDLVAKKFEMSGGYIKKAAVRAALSAAESQRPLTTEDIYEAARAEYREMGRIV